MDRPNARAERIVASAEKIKAKLAANPNHPKAEAWAKRMAEYEKSLDHLSQGLPEKPGGGNKVGVKVSVPKGLFKGKAHGVG